MRTEGERLLVVILAAAFILWFVLLLLTFQGCLVYLPRDAAAYKKQLEDCQDEQQALLNTTGELRNAVETLRVHCR